METFVYHSIPPAGQQPPQLSRKFLEMHESDDPEVRLEALKQLQKENIAVMVHADAVAMMIVDGYERDNEGDNEGDEEVEVRLEALELLFHLEPEALAPHADAVAMCLEDDEADVRRKAVAVLGELDPVTFSQYAPDVFAMLDDYDHDPFEFDDGGSLDDDDLDDETRVPPWVAVDALMRALPPVVTRGVEHDEDAVRSSRLLGRVAWYRCRLLWRAKRLVLYWYALPYRPSGPGHARDVAAWSRMIDE